MRVGSPARRFSDLKCLQLAGIEPAGQLPVIADHFGLHTASNGKSGRHGGTVPCMTGPICNSIHRAFVAFAGAKGASRFYLFGPVDKKPVRWPGVRSASAWLLEPMRYVSDPLTGLTSVGLGCSLNSIAKLLPLTASWLNYMIGSRKTALRGSWVVVVV